MKPLIKIALLIVLIALPIITLAQGVFQPPIGGSDTSGNSFVPLTNIPGLLDQATAPTLPLFLNGLYKIAIGIGATLAVLQIMRAGIMYMGGDSFTEKKEARNLIGLSIGGLVLLLSPFIVFSIINPKILDLSLDFSELQTAPASFEGLTDASVVKPETDAALTACGITATDVQKECVVQTETAVRQTFLQCLAKYANGDTSVNCITQLGSQGGSAAKLCISSLSLTDQTCMQTQIGTRFQNLDTKTTTGDSLQVSAEVNAGATACGLTATDFQKQCLVTAGISIRQSYLNCIDDTGTGGNCILQLNDVGRTASKVCVSGISDTQLICMGNEFMTRFQTIPTQ